MRKVVVDSVIVVGKIFVVAVVGEVFVVAVVGEVFVVAVVEAGVGASVGAGVGFGVGFGVGIGDKVVVVGVVVKLLCTQIFHTHIGYLTPMIFLAQQ